MSLAALNVSFVPRLKNNEFMDYIFKDLKSFPIIFSLQNRIFIYAIYQCASV